MLVRRQDNAVRKGLGRVLHFCSQKRWSSALTAVMELQDVVRALPLSAQEVHIHPDPPIARILVWRSAFPG